MLGFNQASIY